MKKMLSYILWGHENKYWYNVPYLLVANSDMFPDFHMRFYIHKDSTDHPFFVFLKETSERFEKVEIEILDVSYKGTQFSVHRMRPLWEKDIGYLFCRDTDYAVSSLERQCMDYFMEQDKCSIHSIRGFYLHYVLPIYGGLCGFNVKKVFEKIKEFAPTFNEYEDLKYKDKRLSGHITVDTSYKRQWEWESDQLLLRDFFCYAKLLDTILDCPQKDAPLKVACSDNFHPQEAGYVPTLCPSSVYVERKIDCEPRATHFIDELSVSPSLWNSFPPFTGRRWSCVSDYLKKLIRIVNNEMSEAIEKTFIDNFGEIGYRLI